MLWIPQQNKLFGQALDRFDRNTPEWWHKIARGSGKTAEEVKRHYDVLLEDLRRIEFIRVPIPNYRSGAGGTNNGNADEELRYRSFILLQS